MITELATRSEHGARFTAEPRSVFGEAVPGEATTGEAVSVKTVSGKTVNGPNPAIMPGSR